MNAFDEMKNLYSGPELLAALRSVDELLAANAVTPAVVLILLGYKAGFEPLSGPRGQPVGLSVHMEALCELFAGGFELGERMQAPVAECSEKGRLPGGG